MNPNRFTNLYLAFAGGILLWASWPTSPLTFLIFIAWIPLLFVEESITSRKKFFGFVYINMLVWNVLTTWWIWYASVPGAIGAFLANSLLMCLPWVGFYNIKRRFGQRTGHLSLVVFWMTFEYIHLHNWGLSWPWLTLGNVFSMHPGWIQWYEYTGTSGGTLWILLVNIFLFQSLKKVKDKQSAFQYRSLIIAVMLLFFPIVLSVIIKPANIKEQHTDKNIVVVQPDIDPYEKITTGSFEAQLQKLIRLSESAIDSNTQLVIWPETALYMQNGIDEEKMKENFFLNPLWGFLQRHQNMFLFCGVESYRLYDKPMTTTARKIPGDNLYFDSYNGSVLLDGNGVLGYYHKSMLVPGVETLPGFLKFMGPIFEKFGGTAGGYTPQNDRTPLKNERNNIVIAPAICYESIYGEFMSKYIRNGANLICVITNDGWWKKTPGYRQHLNYARLRAIETRTWVARSANTGISCFIDPYGKDYDPQPWDTASAIKKNIPTNNNGTFFVKYGDILSKAASVIGALLAAFSLGIWLKNRFFKK